jgi:hypothetical protein
MKTRLNPLISAALFGALFSFPALAADNPFGAFSGRKDIGEVSKPGSVKFDEAKGTYTIGGSGANMWANTDAFHYVWKKVAGDIALAADIKFAGDGKNSDPHRKACLMIRETLEPDSKYVDVALHGDGLTSLQFREESGGVTREVQTIIKNPKRLQIEKIGDYVYMSVAGSDGVLKPTGSSVRVAFGETFYIGLAVCAHDNTKFEQAVFSNVTPDRPPSSTAKSIRSAVEIMTIASGDRRCVFATEDLIEAPNWTPDGSALIYNGGGKLYRLPLVANAKPELIDTGFAINCNNDHGISPDGTQLVISDGTEEGRSVIYTLPITGGTPKRVTEKFPSYWHGWSPDGKTLAYCAERGGNYDIYTIPVEGGEETRLTDAEGLDDGPDYSPDGTWIYFNSVRTGLMQIWRMHPDGSNQEQVTNDEYANWFPHPAPNGESVVILSSIVPPDTGHPPDGDYVLRQLPTAGGAPRELARFHGGQGSINVPSWSRDSAYVAYVTWEPLP